MARSTAIQVLVLAACSRDPSPHAKDDIAAAERARAATLVGELKKSLLGAVTAALGQGPRAAIETCHAEAPTLTAAVSREGAVVGRATRKPRNPQNRATGWQAEALAHFEASVQRGAALQGQSFLRTLPNNRIGYAEPLVIQEVCLVCHGSTLAPDVQSVLAARYPADEATGYALGQLRGVAWVELPRR